MSEDKNKGANRTAVTVALISSLGVIGAALISNWDKLFRDKESPSPTSIATLSPTPTPSLPLPPPPPTENPQTPRQNNISPSQEWNGTAVQNRHQNYSMDLQIERLSGVSFSGQISWPDLRNSITEINGEIVSNFGDLAEKSKWKLVPNFDSNNSLQCLNFTDSRLVQGSGIVLNGKYYACIEDGIMKGIYFLRPTESTPRKEFTLFLK